MRRFVLSGLAFLTVLFSSSAYAAWNIDPALLQAAGNVATALSPKAKAVVDQANAIKDTKEKENFLVTKAKALLGEKNYEAASQVAQYVITNVNNKSLDAKKILEDAKVKLVETAKAKAAGTKAGQTAQEATAVADSVKNLFGSLGGK
jgi:hypothetical protein